MIILNLRAPNLVSICVDNVEGREFDGRVYNTTSPTATYFAGVSELLSVLDAYYDEINYPQASTRTRGFIKRPRVQTVSGQSDGEDGNEDGSEVDTMAVTPQQGSIGVMAQRGTKATFVVQVQYRQNATWQGNILWTEKNITQNFRSALELLKLIDGSLDDIERSKEK